MKYNALTARKLQTLTEPGYYLDGAGLYLQISKSGTRSWVLRFKMNDRTREMGLGSERTRSLAEARDAARKARQLLLDGVDPIEDRRERKTAFRPHLMAPSFRQDVSSFLAVYLDTWKSDKHRKQWPDSLRRYIFPTLGNTPTLEITTAAINEVLAPVFDRTPDTAMRERERVLRVRKWVEDGKPRPVKREKKHHRHALRQGSGLHGRAKAARGLHVPRIGVCHAYGSAH